MLVPPSFNGRWDLALVGLHLERVEICPLFVNYGVVVVANPILLLVTRSLGERRLSAGSRGVGKLFPGITLDSLGETDLMILSATYRSTLVQGSQQERYGGMWWMQGISAYLYE